MCCMDYQQEAPKINTSPCKSDLHKPGNSWWHRIALEGNIARQGCETLWAGTQFSLWTSHKSSQALQVVLASLQLLLKLIYCFEKNWDRSSLGSPEAKTVQLLNSLWRPLSSPCNSPGKSRDMPTCHLIWSGFRTYHAFFWDQNSVLRELRHSFTSLIWADCHEIYLWTSRIHNAQIQEENKLVTGRFFETKMIALLFFLTKQD